MARSALDKFLNMKPLTLTPSDSPVMSPETKAVMALQEYWRDPRYVGSYPRSMPLAYFLLLAAAIRLLLHERVISAKFAAVCAQRIAAHYHRATGGR